MKYLYLTLNNFVNLFQKLYLAEFLAEFLAEVFPEPKLNEIKGRYTKSKTLG